MKRAAIAQGILNKVFPKPSIEEIYNYRIDICRSNQCKMYDKYGKSPDAVLPGEETCAACSCNLSFKLRVPSEVCGLLEIDQEPLWEAETRYKDEK